MGQMQAVTTVFQLLLSFCNLCIMAYIFVKFINKPHDTLETRHEELVKRVDAHDLKFDEIDKSLHHGNDKFRHQADLNEVFINCMLAFIDFEMAYCSKTDYDDIDDLKNAKATLRAYLAKGKE